ncbi:DUF3800 domain-containing protein [Brevibacterium sp. K11IcPPYGO002]|uniref:DUF3800 domain-containing protein n=1 Tax=Brevibacterium sp. K11IcPPYGO002 TaxID=3058837 RepID=UPI003D814226
MLLAYIDEIGEPGPYVAKDHPRFNTNPVFGYAGFVIPESSARRFGQIFTAEKRRVFASELRGVENPGRWERKGSDIFTPDAWRSYGEQIRVFRGLINRLAELSGRVFFYAEQKEVGTRKQVRLSDEQREASAMRESVNRLCRHADNCGENLLMLMDQINEKQRAARVATIYAHIFSRAQEFREMNAAIEPPMHIDSALSSNIQLANWISASVSRAIDYQLERESKYDWVPQALGSHMHHRITYESKLRLWQSSLGDLNNFDVFKAERPYPDGLHTGPMSPEDLAKLQKVKHATVKRK